MTVAAIVLVPDAAAAAADADGEPAIRRVAHAAWAGGAMPIVVVVADPSEPLAAAVSDSPVTLVYPPAGLAPGIAWFSFGREAALSVVAETTAAMLWPFRYGWIDPETVTSLVEAHGIAPDSIIRPAYAGREGFPILVPGSQMEGLAKRTGLHGEEAVTALIADGAPVCQLELGDPGIVYDLATPRSSLPGYQGPAGPAGPPPEWNSELAAEAQRSGDPER